MDLDCNPSSTVYSRRSTNPKKIKSNKKIASTSKNVLKCGLCAYTTTQGQAMARHIRVHTGEKPYKCQHSNCTASYPTKAELQLHQFVHPGEKPYKCQHPSCEAGFGTSSRLKVHQLVHSKDDERLLIFKCSICPYKTGIKERLINHLKTHSEVRDYPCDLCPFRAKQKAVLFNHHKSVHSTKKPFKCLHENCNLAFKLKGGLINHMKVHSDDQPFVCAVANCDFKTKWAKSFKEHEMAHRGETFKCSFCPYTCIQKFSLHTHIRVHTREAPYPCPSCPYRATHRSNLARHVKKIHLKVPLERRFKCSFCPYVSTHKNAVDVHTRTHTGENPFACLICPFRAKTSGNVLRHVKFRHRAKKQHPEMSEKDSRRSTDLKKCTLSGCSFSTSEDSKLAIHSNQAHNLPRVILVKM